MRLKLLDVGLTSSNMALVEFSDGSFAMFSASDLSNLADLLGTPDPIRAIKPTGITLCVPKLPIHLTHRIRSDAKKKTASATLLAGSNSA